MEAGSMPLQAHFHNYRVVNRSQSHFGTGMRWIERCRCGSAVQCEHSFAVGGNRSETVKHWFNREGDLERITGGSTAKTNTEKPETQTPTNDISIETGEMP